MGRGEDSLLCDPESELRLGGRKKGEDNKSINRMGKSKMK